MVVLGKDKYSVAYEMIQKNALREGCTVLLFVAPTADSLCGVSILTSMFKTDAIKYLIKPVQGYEDLAEQAASLLVNNDDIISVILINCGAIIDVDEFLKLSDVEDRVAYIVDYHRPFHEANVNNRSNVIVLDDKDMTTPLQRSRYEEEMEEEEEEEEESSEASFSSGEENRGRRQHRRAEEDDEDSSSSSSASDLGLPSPSKRQRIDSAINKTDFALGSFYGSSVATLLYELATQRALDTSHLLWLAVMGITDQLIHHKVATKNYTAQIQELKRGLMTKVDRSLEYVDHEFRFMLHRHWTLYDSMYHSTHIASSLGVWNAGGRRKLDELLAKMGFPLHECKQTFSLMSSDVKDLLPGRLETYSEGYQLYDTTYASFLKTFPNKEVMSAADTVYAVNALLELGPSVQLDLSAEPMEREHWERNFWHAYDSLSTLHMDFLKKGISAAINLQRAVVDEGTAILVKGIIVRNGPFRYAQLRESPNLQYFSHPQTLTRLALFLIHSLKRPDRPDKPLVLCCFNPTRKTYLVLGVTPAAPSDLSKRNDFGTSFRNAASITEARIQFHSFDSSVIELQSADVNRFLEYLHSGLVTKLQM